MLLADGFDDLREVQQLVQFLRVQEVGQALAPTVFELDENLDKFDVVFQLRVHHLDVLLVLAKKIFEILERLLDALGKTAHCLRLSRTDSAEDTLRGQQDFAA